MKAWFTGLLLFVVFAGFGANDQTIVLETTNSKLTIPSYTPDSTWRFVVENQSQSREWFVTCGNYDTVVVTINNTAIYTGGWDFPVDKEHVPMLRGGDSQLLIFIQLPEGINRLSIAYGEAIVPPMLPDSYLLSRATVERANTAITDYFLFGALSIMILLNLLVFVVLRERSYLLYALAHFFFLLNVASVVGYVVEFVTPHQPSMLNTYLWNSGNGFYLFYSLFLFQFFGRLKSARKVVAFYIGLIAVATIVQLLPIDSRPWLLPLYLSSFFFGVILFAVIIVQFLRKSNVTRADWLVVAGTTLFVVGTIFSILAERGLLGEKTDFKLNFYKYASIIEAFMLLLALARRAILERKEREMLQLALNSKLTDQVEAQTRELIEKNNQLQNALSDKEVLMSEVHHRVKNNLQLVNSLLFLQARSTADESARAGLVESLSRVNAISIVHHKLYMDANPTAVVARTYLAELVDSIAQIYNKDKRVLIDCQADEFELAAKKAIPLGLIINELITNAFKHALAKGPGSLAVELRKQQNTITLRVQDSGAGHTSAANSGKGMGSLILANMVKQLKGNLSTEHAQGWLSIVIFEVDE